MCVRIIKANQQIEKQSLKGQWGAQEIALPAQANCKIYFYCNLCRKLTRIREQQQGNKDKNKTHWQDQDQDQDQATRTHGPRRDRREPNRPHNEGWDSTTASCSCLTPTSCPCPLVMAISVPHLCGSKSEITANLLAMPKYRKKTKKKKKKKKEITPFFRWVENVATGRKTKKKIKAEKQKAHG